METATAWVGRLLFSCASCFERLWAIEGVLGCRLQICDAYNANRYPFPEDPARQRQMNAEVTARLRELHTTIEAGDAPRHCL